LPPPAAPPYSTSRSPDARYCVCGPGLGLNTMFCALGTSYSAALGAAGIFIGATASFTGVVTDSFRFKDFDLT